MLSLSDKKQADFLQVLNPTLMLLSMFCSFFLIVTCAGLRFMFVAFPDHIHLLFEMHFFVVVYVNLI